MDLAFVPLKNVMQWVAKGYTVVPDCQRPRGWAVLMCKGGAGIVPAPEPTEKHERFTKNTQRARSIANTRRFARAREAASA